MLARRLFSTHPSIVRLKAALTQQIETQEQIFDSYKPITNYVEELGFEIEDDPWSRKVTLTKQIQESLLEVKFWAVSDIPEEVDEPDDQKLEQDEIPEYQLEESIVPCQVSITNPGLEGIVVEGEVANGDFEIYSVTIAPHIKEIEPKSEYGPQSIYRGPQYQTLDPVSYKQELQESFNDYITNAGLDEKIGIIVNNYSAAKYTSLYINWLETLQKVANAL